MAACRRPDRRRHPVRLDPGAGADGTPAPRLAVAGQELPTTAETLSDPRSAGRSALRIARYSITVTPRPSRSSGTCICMCPRRATFCAASYPRPDQGDRRPLPPRHKTSRSHVSESGSSSPLQRGSPHVGGARDRAHTYTRRPAMVRQMKSAKTMIRRMTRISMSTGPSLGGL